MIINLREQKQKIITEIGGLEEEYKNGHIPIDELEEKKQKLEDQLNDIQTKLDDKKTKLDAAMTQLEELTGMKENLKRHTIRYMSRSKRTVRHWRMMPCVK